MSGGETKRGAHPWEGMGTQRGVLRRRGGRDVMGQRRNERDGWVSVVAMR